MDSRDRNAPVDCDVARARSAFEFGIAEGLLNVCNDSDLPQTLVALLHADTSLAGIVSRDTSFVLGRMARPTKWESRLTGRPA